MALFKTQFFVQITTHRHRIFSYGLEFDHHYSSPCLNGGTCTDGIDIHAHILLHFVGASVKLRIQSKFLSRC